VRRGLTGLTARLTCGDVSKGMVFSSEKVIGGCLMRQIAAGVNRGKCFRFTGEWKQLSFFLVTSQNLMHSILALVARHH